MQKKVSLNQTAEREDLRPMKTSRKKIESNINADSVTNYCKIQDSYSIQLLAPGDKPER